MDVLVCVVGCVCVGACGFLCDCVCVGVDVCVCQYVCLYV